jgi:hypothetical protein
MAMMLRAAYPDDPVPTRLVQGFLPGDRSGTTETVLNKNAHAWVEVYFPGYGWIPFDPTGGNLAQLPAIPAGPAVVASPTPGASQADVPDPTRQLQGRDPDRPTGGPSNSGSTPGDRSMFVLLTVLLAAVVAVVAFAAWMRGPRGEVNPDNAWLALSRAASRFGFAPRPTQTVYEYASDLGDLVPVARQDLHTVAVAKVETYYARVRLGGARLQAVRDATRRLRISLLRLLVHRGRRRRS